MYTYLIFEKLAHMTHFDVGTQRLISLLPTNIYSATKNNNNHLIRQLLGGHNRFADAKTVVM